MFVALGQIAQKGLDVIKGIGGEVSHLSDINQAPRTAKQQFSCKPRFHDFAIKDTYATFKSQFKTVRVLQAQTWLM
jgi:hypothetical protein